MTGGAWWRRTTAVAVVSFFCVGAARAAASDDEAPPQSTLRATAVTPATARPASEGAEVQLDQRWLPVESRTDLGNYAGLNVPGVTLAAGGAGLEIRGGSARDTATSLDGFRIAPLLVFPSALAGAEIYTAGYGADLADVPGGAIVTRIQSPSNQFRVAADAFHDLRNPERNAASATVSGPLVRDRLFALVSVTGDLWTARLAPDAEGILAPPPPASRQSFTGAMKLAWRAHARHTVESLTIVGQEGSENGASYDVAPAAQPSVGGRALFTALTWRGAITDRLTLRSQVGLFTGNADLEPMLCRQEPEDCDVVAPRVQRFPRTVHIDNGPVRARWRTRAWEVVNGAELRGDPVAWMAHRARLTSRLIFRDAGMSESIPTGRVDELGLGTPDRRTELAGGPGWAAVDAASMRTVHSFDDRLALWGRLWINPGVALVTARVATPDESVLQDLSVTPHLGVAWDATGDQRTWLRASAHRRIGTHFEETAALAPGLAARRICRWDVDTSTFSRDCVTAGGPERRTVGLPCGPANVAPDGSRCAVPPRMPSTWEVTIGGRREIVRDFTVDLDLVQRRASGLPGVRETNQVWQTTTNDVGRYRTGRPGLVEDWSTTGSMGRRYVGATASLEKRAGRFRALAAYSWSRLEVDFIRSTVTTDNPRADYQDVVAGDFHGIRLLATADLLGHASLGLIYSYDRGGLRFTTLAAGPDYRGRVGVSPGVNVNDPSDDRPWVAPESQRLNLQVRARARRLLPVDVDVYLDVINLLDFGAVLPDPSAPDFLPGYRVQEPRWFRVGAEWRY